MVRYFLFLSTVLLAIGLPSLHFGVAGEADGERVVVLRNGRVLRGKVTYLGDRCLIALAAGGDIRLPVKDVSVDCDTLNGAYVQLRDRQVVPRTTKSRLDLANWCMREELFEQAAAELIEAMRGEPDHPDLERAYRQLKYLSERKSNPVTTAPTAGLSAGRPAPVDALETTVNSLRKEVVAEFPSAIQPLLMNRCAGGHCHEGNSNVQFKLFRPGQGTSYWRRLTLRNLQSVMEQVDRSNADRSPLLQKPLLPHGGLATPVFGDKEAGQFQMLVDWVRRAAPSTVSADTSDADSSTNRSTTAGGLATDARPTAEPGTVVPTSATAPRDSGGAKGEAESIPARRVGDPFDPEEFNREFGTKAPSNH